MASAPDTPVRTRTRAIGDLALAACVIMGASILFIGASSLPPPRFEPLGSAAMPRILGAILIALAVTVAARAILTLARSSNQGSREAAIQLPHRGIIVFALLVAYIAALDFARVPFAIATTLFVMCAGMTMHQISVRSALVHCALGLVLSLSIDYIFSTYLFVRIG
ncbi:MAG: tripartite tricarboxylate transporter TctB family protein [Pseudomonadota bacterium]